MRNCDDVGRRGYSAAGPRIFICLPLADARFGPWETPVLIGKLFWWSQNHRKSGKFPIYKPPMVVDIRNYSHPI